MRNLEGGFNFTHEVCYLLQVRWHTEEIASKALGRCLSARLLGGSSMRRAQVRGAHVSMHRSCNVKI